MLIQANALGTSQITANRKATAKKPSKTKWAGSQKSAARPRYA